jgi:hypothetical protein
MTDADLPLHGEPQGIQDSSHPRPSNFWLECAFWGWRLFAVMHTSGRVEDESSRVSSGRVAHSRVEASGVEWCQEQWHNGKRVG